MLSIFKIQNVDHFMKSSADVLPLFYFYGIALNIRNQGQRRLSKSSLNSHVYWDTLYSWFWMQIKRKLRTFFIRYFINITCMFYIEKTFFIARTLMYRFQYICTCFFMVSMLLPLFHFLADLNGRVQLSNQ